ncbi:uncharacterized protein TNCT_142231 [Trichonephila clavata]|uniref:Monocarboxylate transporter n=1 Tax=Trichonephila clavata TaxID=2740835 RepID=A0A8X6F6D2_TRICU|nr:uncharacterized protein TNCT_142231 [Trichonephila clavata]
MLSGALLHTLPVCLILRILDQPRSSSLQTVETADCLNEHETKLNQNSFEEHSISQPSEVSGQKVASTLSGFKLLLDPVFFVIMFTQSLLLYVNVAILTIFVDISRDHGVSTENEVYPLIGFSVADAIGRVFLGSVTDGGYLTKMNFSALCFAAIGLLITVFVWIKGFAMVMFFSLFCGLFNGGLFMIGPSMCMHYVEDKYYSFAIASRYFLYAPLSFTQAPFIGYFRDTLQSYDGLLYILIGICYFEVEIHTWLRNYLRIIFPFKMKIDFLDTKRKCLILGLICFIAFLILGISRLSGLLFVACMARYDTGRKQASLPFILGYTIRNVSGPFVGYLGKRFGLVTVTVLGCLLSTVGVGACFFAQNIVAVIFLWGIIYGLGCGMGTSLLPLILSQYFEKHVDKANGIYSGGACIGAFILPVIADKLIAEYGTSGITSESPKESHLHEEKRDINSEKNIESSEHGNGTPSELFKIPNESVFYIDIHQKKYKTQSKYNEEHKYSKPFNKTATQNDKEAEIKLSEIKTVAEDINTNLPVVLRDVAESDNIEESELSQSSLYSKYLKKYESSSSGPNRESTSNSFHVFLDVAYILILLIQGFMLIVITTLWTVIVDASMDKGITKQEGVYILICMGITDTIGRFCLGYITDGGRMSKINFQILCAAGLGVFHILFIFLEGFIMVIIAVGFAGLFTAGHIMIGVGIISQCIGKEYVTMAIASRYFAFALMSFTQAPMIGFFREKLNSYDGLFILLTVICGICIVLTWFTPIAARRRNKKKQLR